MGTSSISPQTQAIAGRQVQIADAQQDMQHRNTAAKSKYDESVRQWVWNKEQQKVGTPLGEVPIPPLSWVIVPHAYTAEETLYDASYPGIPALVDIAQTGPPVAAQYVEPGAPVTPTAGTVVAVGPYMRDGEYACLPSDNMPVGYITKAPDGTWVKKAESPTPWGVAHYYTSKVA